MLIILTKRIKTVALKKNLIINILNRNFVMKSINLLIATIALLIFSTAVHAQPGAEIEVKKPKQYEKRKLGAEKTGEKKFTVPRKLYQNTVTHYNYYFNANNRLNDLVSAAKSSFKDDYSQLLPFYNYTLDLTSQNKTEIDSIIYKCTAGILLHDLRNGWIDNMYLLLAKAYFFRNDLDSAGLTLQYLNFAYAPKEEGGYNIPIGSNASNDKGEFSIATKEKNSIFNKLTSRPPSRNESFIWQIRNHIEKDELPEAAGIIEILKTDPNFPERLQTNLNEMLGYWFYKQQVYDSSANYLRKALSEAANSQEKARWEYLIAQMYQLAGKNDEAIEFYNKSISHTTDPVMDVYARLNSIRILRKDEKDYLQENIDALLKMAKRDKYENYRDIIYYAAATIELERKNYDGAENDLQQSVKYSVDNPNQRSQAFLLLADINYNQRKYPEASDFYDSLDVNLLSREDDKNRVELRKPPLKTVSENTSTVFTQDSLQALASMPAEKREAIIKKQLKLLRKAQGLKEEETTSFNPAVQNVPDLFSADEKSNDFYFYNASTKARGFSEFKARWGERPNVDNWRRRAAINQQTENIADVGDVADQAVADNPLTEIATTYEGMLANIPLTEEQLQESNRSIMDALFSMGYTFMSRLEEYPSAIHAYEELLRRFPETTYKDEALFNLVYAYHKVGNVAKAEEYKKLLLASAPESPYVERLKNPNLGKKDPQAIAATKKYEDIYNMFIEGRFDQAKSEKKVADSLYGNSYWTPQLLFIESIYYIKQQEDSTAIQVLTDLTSLYNDNPMAEKARTMIDVLKRRKEIENYLANLNVTRNEDLAVKSTSQTVAVVPKNDPPEVDVPEKAVPGLSGTTAIGNKKDRTVTAAPKIKNKKGIELPKPDTTLAILGLPDTTLAIPGMSDDTLAIPGMSDDTLALPGMSDDTLALPGMSDDTLALPGMSDTLALPGLPDTTLTLPDTTTTLPIEPRDTIVTPTAPVVVKNFTFIESDPHYVVIMLDKVDKVYASEARNAFNRYNREKFNNRRIDMNSLALDERFQLVLEGPFADANAAAEYLQIVKPIAAGRIVPWLTPNKYSFIIISNTNLELLKANKDVEAYKELMLKAFPGKF